MSPSNTIFWVVSGVLALDEEVRGLVSDDFFGGITGDIFQ
jgi:hypothetical protein